MGDGKILTGAIIAGIAIMLALSVIPAYAGHPSPCPMNGASQVSAALKPEKDKNGNGFICFVPDQGRFGGKFTDDVIHK